MKTDWSTLIRELREEAGLSQRELAKRAAVNRSTIRRIESGDARGDIDSLETLMGALGYELEVVVQSAPASQKERRHGEDHRSERRAFH